MKTLQTATTRILKAYRSHEGMVIIPGVVLAAAGIIAVMAPVAGGVDVRFALGFVLIAAALARAAFALHSRSSSQGLVGFGLSAMGMMTGAYLLATPALRHDQFALLIAGYLLVDGLFSAVHALLHRERDGWGWLLAAAGATIFLGSMVLYQQPLLLDGSITAAAGLFLVLTGAAVAHLGVAADGMAERLTLTHGGEEDTPDGFLVAGRAPVIAITEIQAGKSNEEVAVP